MKGQSETCEPEWVGAEHPLFILYTSGSTGKPKGIQHSTGGYLLWTILTMKWVFDYKPTDVFWCTADVGWVTGHSYVCYGPLACGATEIIFEGVPTYPDAGRFWKMIQDHKVTRVLHRADRDPLAHQGRRRPAEEVRPLVAAHPRHGRRADQPRSVDVVPRDRGRRPLPDRRHLVADGDRRPHDHAAAGRDADQARLGDVPPARHHRRTSWTKPATRSARARAASSSSSGRGPRCCARSGATRSAIKKTYYPEDFQGKYYLAGDGATYDEDGYIRIMGRIDDVLNVSGHRLGTMEIESALVANPKVAEAAVVGPARRPDRARRSVAFVVLKQARPDGDEAQKIVKELQDWVGKEIGAIAKPKDIRFGDNLPKTRSGKIMRRLLRSIAKGEEITQDVSTLENPAILEQLKRESALSCASSAELSAAEAA